MNGRIAKLKTVDGRIHIRWIEGEGSQREKEITLKSAEHPHPDFVCAFTALEAHARAILEWPAEYAKGRIKLTGCTWSFSESTEVEGAVITGQVMLETADAPFSFNTPHLPFDQYSETGASKLMPAATQDALELVRTEAAAFIEGKRAQGSLPFFEVVDDDKPDDAPVDTPAASKPASKTEKKIDAKASAKETARAKTLAAADRAERRSTGKPSKKPAGKMAAAGADA